jgi:outer membrane receptor protein involved in Fe transport
LKCLLSLVPIHGAQAENEAQAEAARSGGLEEIVVTAQRRSESILSVPISVSAVSGDDLAAQHIVKLEDLTSQFPNVEINSSRGNSLTDIVIRGVGIANDFTVNQPSPVGVYTDDVYSSSRSFAMAQVFDLERTEVLRGPQGTLFGRNTTGGLVNFVTRSPGLHADKGFVDIGYGNFNDVRVQGAYEHTFAPDTSGVRAALSYESHDGYYHNIHPNAADADDLDTVAVRLEARWRAADSLDMTLKVYGQRDNNHQWNGRALLVGASAEIPPDPFDVNLTTGFTRTSSYGALLKIVGQLSQDWTLTSLTSYDVGHLTLEGVDLDGRADPGQLGYTAQFQRANFDQGAEEFRLSHDSDTWRAVFGLYFGQDTVQDSERYDVFIGVPFSPIFRYVQRRTSKAVFAQGDYGLTHHLTLTAGVRYTDDSVQYRDGHADVATPLAPNGTLTNTLPGAGTALCPGQTCPDATLQPLMGTNGATTGRIALTYKFDGGEILYASANHGYRSGAFNGNAYLTLAQLAYVRPETVNAYEVGVKGSYFDQRLSASAAVFYNDYRNQQINFLRGEVTFLGPLPVNILANVPRATTQGFEFEGALQVTEGVRVHAALGLLDATYGAGALAGGFDLSHNRLPYAPRASGKVGADWTIGRLAGGAIRLSPDVVYSGRYYFDPTDSPITQTHGYTLLNTGLSWEGDTTAVRLWGKNLTDRKYNVYGLDLSHVSGYYFFSGNDPRTLGISVSHTF